MFFLPLSSGSSISLFPILSFLTASFYGDTKFRKVRETKRYLAVSNRAQFKSSIFYRDSKMPFEIARKTFVRFASISYKTFRS